MNDRIIAKNRYKKVSKKSIRENRISNLKNFDHNGEYKKKKCKRESIFSLTIVKIFLSILAIFLLGILSKLIIFNDNKESIVSVFFNSDENKYEQNYKFKVGVFSSNDNIIKSHNLIENDMYKNLASVSLIDIDTSYKIVYKLATNIEYEKLENNLTKYAISLDKKYNINSESLKKSIYKILSNEENIYYNKLSNISDVIVVSEFEAEIITKDYNPYFIYYLNFPVYIDTDLERNVRNLNFKYVFENNNYTFINNIKNDKIYSIDLNRYDNSQVLIEDFKNKKIDSIVISSDNLIKLLGRYDYYKKSYRDGKSLFLFGNPNSEIFKIKEIRQAILYSINREEILKSQNNSFLELIDVPYIYSKITYKYDITAANNVLLSNGFVKEGGIYKKGDSSAIVRLIVNSDDENKCKIAEMIKSYVELNGIRMDIEKLNNEEIKSRVQNGKDYDLILADVVLDDTPDITIFKDFLYEFDEVREDIINLENSNIKNLEQNVLKLYEDITNNILCIGIYISNSSIIYQKDIVGFDNISYFNLFKEYTSLKKIKQ